MVRAVALYINADMARAVAPYINADMARAVAPYKECGYGGIGRRAGFRFLWATVQVQLLLSAPNTKGTLQGALCVWYEYCKITGVEGGDASGSERFALRPTRKTTAKAN